MRLLTAWLCLFGPLMLASAAPKKQTKQKQRPHIVVIMADDLGWSDVSFHQTPQIPTPNIDALASDGIILHNHYVQPMCTPSRAAFLTGLYPIRTGMQHYVIRSAEPWGLPLNVKIMPQFFKELGYNTHAIGKWHLGNHMEAYAPTRRGFDTFMGYHLGYGDYYKHVLQLGQEIGSDFFEGVQPILNATGLYSTDLFTERAVSIIDKHDKSKPMFMYLCHMAPHSGNEVDPLQAPQEYIDKFQYIENKNRSTYAAMLNKLDESVGIIMEALHRNDMLNNTILLFLSDNGGKPWGKQSNYAFNWPLRGMKEMLWEGGVRSSSFLWSPLLEQTPRISNQMMHVTDWLPTLYGAAGVQTSMR
ncbi:arylsulfatase B-like isoform X2 [Ornithodoros turicata]|uniref:arylsulfatase B-like isoform X2 n=1 Tax=Ornithodoros turicata TaxID=34597 RepID=UPI00313A144B